METIGSRLVVTMMTYSVCWSSNSLDGSIKDRRKNVCGFEVRRWKKKVEVKKKEDAEANKGKRARRG